MLVERGETGVAPALRELLKKTKPSAVITALRTLDPLGALAPADLRPFLAHSDAAVRIHALQMGDHWFAQDEDRPLLDAALTAATAEKDPRV